MRPLSAVELLDIWEQGSAQSTARQALLLLTNACPERSRDDLARLSIGERDRRLLRLREWTFGPALVGLAECPSCGERLTLSFQTQDVQGEPETEPDQNLTLSEADYDVRFRLPNSLDVEAVASAADVDTGRRLLLDRCVLSARRGDREIAAADLPTELVKTIAARMAQADPQSEVQLALTCPACDCAWHAVFDIASFFWGEIETWAYRTLRQIHVLASSYGWSEADTLAVSPWRRQVYLDMVE